MPTTVTQRLIIVLLIALGAGFFFATYRAIDNIVAEQSHVQQEAMSPVFKLVRDELLRPLYIAETFASSIDFTTMTFGKEDEQRLLNRLAEMKRDLGLTFFVASEQSRTQYFSNGETLALIEGEVWWYFEAMERDKDFMADLGQVGDVHLFYDVKMRSPDGEFLGYVGVGKPVQRFLKTFDLYKAQFGYDFMFVNDENEIILSSLPDLVVTDAYIPTLESLSWFAPGRSSDASYDSEIIDVQDEDFLISEFGIEELGWRLLLLVPLEARQAQITSAFIKNALAAVLIVAMVAGLVFLLMLLYKRGLERETEIDPLTGVPNRLFAQRRFAELERAQASLCVIIIDLDYFKSVNDEYGHDAGDRALKAAVTVLAQDLRERDAICRWGGEEFVMLIPSATIDSGKDIAERARENLERMPINIGDTTVSITASFGLAFGSAKEHSFADLLARADQMLYRAKQQGRNQVRVFEAV